MRHTLTPDCDCSDCQRAAFEHRAVLVVLGGVIACAALAWIFFVGVP